MLCLINCLRDFALLRYSYYCILVCNDFCILVCVRMMMTNLWGLILLSCLSNSFLTFCFENSTVDYLTLISNPESSPYLVNGDFWLSLHLLRSLSSHLRIHILTNSQWVISHGRELGFYMYDFSSRNKPYFELHEKFVKMYMPNHHSINALEYEYLCFFRWHLFRRVVDDWEKQNSPMERIITADSDVVLFTDASKLYQGLIDCYSPKTFELFTIIRGALQFWSPHGLRQYSEFIYDWYNKSAITITNMIKQEGSHESGVLHFSDMQVFHLYLCYYL